MIDAALWELRNYSWETDEDELILTAIFRAMYQKLPMASDKECH